MSRADVLGCEFVTGEVALPNGKKATVRELSAGERGRFFALTKDIKDPTEMYAWLAAWGSIEADGSRSFADADVPELMQRPHRVLQPLAEKVLMLSGLAEDETKKD